MNTLEDTIAAIATPLGEGGLAVIRISGKNAIAISDIYFKGKKTLAASQSHTAHFGNFLDKDGCAVDEVVATIFLAPNSYTGDDVVEISCHGGIFIQKKILSAVISGGAKLSEPGEFTKRRYLNGKIDLSQAEAISDLIHSRSEFSHKASLNQLKGKLSEQITSIRNSLLDLCGLLELELDFVEEGYEFTDREKLESEIRLAQKKINYLLSSFRTGKFYRDGVKVVISGKPNSGKSSIFNALLEDNRAIVTNIPGTTRDVIEEELILEGTIFRFFDTAGLRATSDIVEAEGVRRSYEQISSSDLILRVFDCTEKDYLMDLENELKNDNNNLNSIAIINKIDLLTKEENKRLSLKYFDRPVIFTSALNWVGIKQLQAEILIKTIFRDGEMFNSNALTNIRHKQLLEKSAEKLESSLITLKNSSSELLVTDIRSAMNYLGEIVGVVTTEELLNNIFSKFCIGK
jgi:tRNA modification GTPase